MQRTPFINRGDKRNISQFSYTGIFVTRTTKLLSVVEPPYIYLVLSTWKTFWEEKFTPANMRIYNKNFRLGTHTRIIPGGIYSLETLHPEWRKNTN